MLRALMLSTALAAAACNPYDPNLGSTPFRCGTSDPVCPDGYRCVEHSAANRLCEPDDGSQLADGGDSDGAALSCSPPLPDSELEPNEDIGDPTITPIPPNQDFDVIGAAICSDSDVDMYKFTVDVNGKNGRIEVTYDAGAGTLLVDMLNSSGVSIRAAVPTGGDANKLRADVANLAQGTYFAQIKGMPGVRNQYSVAFLVTADPLPP
ncbi:MAG TPA: hypothetical protein VL172_17000, partial [Kofleriaceae bacterium]|nr:hypothetical protein [Kofleriaceae bacterium]